MQKRTLTNSDIISLQSSTLHKRERRSVAEKPITQIAERIYEVWDSLGLRQSRRTSKVFYVGADRIRELTNGHLFDRFFSEEEIKTAIRRFAVAVKSPDHAPADKSLVKNESLSTFIYNPHATTEFARSKFRFYLEHEAVLLVKPINQEVFELIRAEYCRRVLGSLCRHLPLASEQKLAEGANKLVEFVSFLRSKKKFLYPITPKVQVNWLFDSMMARFPQIYVGHVSSDFTFNTILPEYLVAQGLVDNIEYKGKK